MIKHRLPALDKDLGTLCLGSDSFGSRLTREQSFEILDAFVGMGGNFIDTARLYSGGASERLIGEWMRERGNRASLTIATKGGHPPVDNMTEGRLDKENLTRDLNESLEALGVETIDLYWLHRDDESRPVEEILTTLNEFIEQKKIRAIGASNWSPARLHAAWGKAFELGLSGFCASQPLWSLARAEQLEDKTLFQMNAELYDWHNDTHMACVPFTAQAKGFFQKMAAGGEAALGDKARMRYLNEHNLKVFDVAKAIAEESGLGIGAVALAFLSGQEEFPVFPIVGVSNMEQASALAEAADAQLTDEQMERLLAASELMKNAESDE